MQDSPSREEIRAETINQPRVYLAGAMERAPGRYGEEWREDIQAHAEDVGFKVWNPYEQEPFALKEFGYSHPSEWIALRHGSAEDKAKHEAIIAALVKYDLDKVMHETELIACRWDEYAHQGGGTNAELTTAFMHNVPVITWVSCPIEEVPAWLLPCMGTKVFNIDDFKAAIADIFVELDN